HRHLLSTPHPQGRRRPRPKKLHFRAVLGEGVPGDEEAEHRFFPYQALVLGPGGYVREPGARSRELGRLAEECVLTGEPFLLTDWATRSVLPISDDSSAAMNSAG